MDASTLPAVSTLVSPAVVYSAIGGFLVMAVTSLIKSKWFVNVNPQWVVIGVSALLGLSYAVFTKFLGLELQEKILDFVWASMTANVFIYEFIWKNINGARQ